MMSQDDSYVLQSLIGTTWCESLIAHRSRPKRSDLTFIYSVRAKLRAADEDFDWLSSYHSRCFYAKYEPNVDRLESGYLKSMLLIQVCQFPVTFQIMLCT
jgi:hypothetical protein